MPRLLFLNLDALNQARENPWGTGLKVPRSALKDRLSIVVGTLYGRQIVIR